MTNLCVPLREATAKAGCVKKTRPPPRHHLPKFLEQTTHTAMLAAFCVTLEYYVLVKVFAAAAGTADKTPRSTDRAPRAKEPQRAPDGCATWRRKQRFHH